MLSRKIEHEDKTESCPASAGLFAGGVTTASRSIRQSDGVSGGYWSMSPSRSAAPRPSAVRTSGGSRRPRRKNAFRAVRLKSLERVANPAHIADHVRGPAPGQGAGPFRLWGNQMVLAALSGRRSFPAHPKPTGGALRPRRCNTSSGPFCESRAPFSDASRPRAIHSASSPADSVHSIMSARSTPSPIN